VDITTSVSPQVFGVRLEQTFAPRHAFLVYRKLPHGIELMKQADFGNNTLWEDFILSCRTTKRFVALCQAWQQRYCMDENPIPKQITAKQVEAFDALFSRGIMAAARNELVQYNNTWPLDYVDITPSELIGLLIQHGADPRERDVRGVTLLHWAAGTGNLDALIELSNYIAINVTTNRDGATLLHWAAAGVNSREFGIGGHPAVCEYLLAQFDSSKQRREYLNQKTKDGNSAVMWAAWSGTIDIVKLLVRNRASLEGANRNGCTVAHWAASGGNLEVCRYLYETCRVDFTAANNGGNSPLTHAVAFGRASVVDWLSKEVCSNVKDENALQLAHDFVTWADGDSHRRHILDSLYERDLYDDEFK
jgi:ankyrin repeat protein